MPGADLASSAMSGPDLAHAHDQLLQIAAGRCAVLRPCAAERGMELAGSSSPSTEDSDLEGWAKHPGLCARAAEGQGGRAWA
eukprot:1094350-Rhodomonas_salina.1